MINKYLKSLIKEKGAISIHEFMSVALYHDKYGYYMKEVPLVNDFITAPEISQLFSEIISVWLMISWEKIKGDFILVELGPGRGTLINDILRVTQKFKEFYDSISTHLVEISPTLRQIQKQNLENFNVHWHDSIYTLPEKPMLLIANEFFDSLPIRQFVYNQGKWYENKVTVENDVFKIKKQKIKEQKEMLYDSKEMLHDNVVIEVCQVGIEIVKKIEKRIKRNNGSALIVDYGYLNPPYRSTIQSVKANKYNNFLENIGSADITVHVNFKALLDCIQDVKTAIITQREFLYSFGVRERMHLLMKNATDDKRAQILRGFLRITENMGTLFKVMII